MFQSDRLFIRHVLVRNEATFHNNGCVNRHNFHYYSQEKLGQINREHQWSVNICGGYSWENVIGP